MSDKNPVGKPPKYRSVKQLEQKIEQYFESCRGHLLEDPDTGKPMIYKGLPVYEDQRPPTITGLALALGFATRAGLIYYQGKPQFEDAILRAKSRIEQYTEERLFDRDGSAGARFSLQNNFKGWKTATDVNIAAAEEDDVMVEIRRRMADVREQGTGNREQEMPETASPIPHSSFLIPHSDP